MKRVLIKSLLLTAVVAAIAYFYAAFPTSRWHLRAVKKDGLD
jgi:hypothetical protein